MIKVQAHGNKSIVSNPVDGSETTVRNVIFTEEGRGGANRSLSASSDFLNQITGKNSGLIQIRTHTQPVLESEIGLFPVGKEFPGHINRHIFSTPQMGQQEGRDARMVDGKPAYFTTELGAQPLEDDDQRMSNETLAQINPQAILRARTVGTTVRIVEMVPRPGNFSNVAERVVEGQQDLAQAGI